MSTNANASSGAGKRELSVSKVREEEINRHIRDFTGNESTIVVADCAITAFTDNVKETETAAGSSVLVDNTGKIDHESPVKNGAVTLIARNIETLKDKKNEKGKKDKKTSREDEELEESRD